MPNYSRKQNTDNYQVRVERQITKADALLRKLKAPVLGFEDLIALNRDVEQGLAASRDELTHIYDDAEIVEPLGVSTNLDLEEISHQDIKESLERIVSERVAKLRDIVAETRAFDGVG
jgi:hypothetical protein